MVLIEQSCVEKILISISTKAKKKILFCDDYSAKASKREKSISTIYKDQKCFFEKAFYIFVLILSFVYILARTSLL